MELELDDTNELHTVDETQEEELGSPHIPNSGRQPVPQKSVPFPQ